MNVMDYIPEYETLTGKPLDPVIVEFWQLVHNSGMEFTAKGRMDKKANKHPLVDSVFSEWAKGVCGDNPEFARHLENIMKKYYFDGRNEVQ